VKWRWGALLVCAGILLAGRARAQAVSPETSRPKVLIFYSLNVETDHVLFALDALRFYAALAEKDHFTLDATTNLQDFNESHLKQYRLVVWLNTFPQSEPQRQAFETYMSTGGAWLGFHVAAYNDKTTHWPWFLQFIGGGVFDANSWPPLPAKLVVDDRSSPVTRNLPESFMSPTNEWYRWKPSPRADSHIHVLITLDPANYPLGIKGLLTYGDVPVVWTNTQYKMLYMNMGHGDKIFSSPVQNTLIQNATEWLLGSGGGG
jgi:type 1 glutamine amidotransferase